MGLVYGYGRLQLVRCYSAARTYTCVWKLDFRGLVIVMRMTLSQKTEQQAKPASELTWCIMYKHWLANCDRRWTSRILAFINSWWGVGLVYEYEGLQLVWCFPGVRTFTCTLKLRLLDEKVLISLLGNSKIHPITIILVLNTIFAYFKERKPMSWNVTLVLRSAKLKGWFWFAY